MYKRLEEFTVSVTSPYSLNTSRRVSSVVCQDMLLANLVVRNKILLWLTVCLTQHEVLFSPWRLDLDEKMIGYWTRLDC